MKKALAVLLLLGGCATLAPMADPKPSPRAMGVYDMEIEACGELAVDTSACVFSAGETITGEIRIRVPRTNTANTAASLELVSAECNYNKVFPAYPGQTVVVPVASVLQPGKSCSLQAVLVVVWDKQKTFTFPVTPLVGRVLLLTLEHSLTPVNSSKVLGFAHTNELVGAQNGPDLTVDTQGSSFGQVLYSGCGAPVVVIPYSAPNPVLSLPKLVSSCLMFGTVQPLDKPESFSFAVARTSVPAAYETLTPPILTASTGQSDPLASAVDFGDTVARSGKFKVPKALATAEYNIRQVTTSGRFSLTHVKNGAVEWSLP